MLIKLKKILVIMLVSMLLGCSSFDTDINKKEKRFLAEDIDKVALFTVGDDLDSVVFDNKKQVYKTNDYNELLMYLKKNQMNKK